jgi:photosystem II stability/assembly factor-like uncharacterized protein
MKKLLLYSSLIFLALLTNSYSQWRQALTSTYPSGTTFRSFYFADQNTGWVVGSNGIILKTVNGGDNWTEQNSGTNVTLYTITGLNQNTLFVGGGSRTLLKSTDGGTTWTSYTLDIIPEPNAFIAKIKVFDQNLMYVLAVYSTTVGRIYKTTDGGNSWTQLYANTTNNLNDFDFASPNVGVAVGRNVGTLFYTTDGTNWNQAPTPSLGGFNYTRSDVRAVRMLDVNTAVAVGWGSFAAGLQPSIHLRTTNGGANWTYMTQQEQNRSYDNLYNIWFKDAYNGLAIGGAIRGSVIERTTDGGINWTPIAAPFGPTLYGIFGIGDKVWIGGSDGLIAYTTDFGNTWKKITPIPAATIYDICFAGPNSGFAAGYDGTLFKTNDGGQTWTSSYIFANNVAPNVNGIQFLNENVGYAAHSYRLITKTTNGGNSWFAVLPDSLTTTGHNYGLFFLNENLGWVCGQYTTSNGVIHKTTNGGQTWTTYQNVVAKAIRAIAFKDENNGVAVGASITALYTTNGGATWQSATVNGMTTGDLRDVVYLTPTRLIACGTNAILKSEDGGHTWNLLPVSVPNLLYALTFKDAMNGYAVGTSGLVYQTTDGGDNWTQITDPLFTSTLYAAASDQNGNPWFGSLGSNLYTYSAQAQVTFNINMRVAILKGKFTPSTDLLVIRGNFNGWSGNADQLSDPDGDSVYSITKTFNIGDNLEFKFVIVRSGQDFWEDQIPNRTYTVQAGTNVYNGGYFNNDSVYVPQFPIQFTFSCNMELERLSGRFNPATDTVSVNGTFNGWASKAWILTPNPLNPDLYEGTWTINAGVGESIEFKFWYTPNNWESRPNRVYTFTQGDINAGSVFYSGSFNDASLATVLNQPATIKFTVNTNGAVSIINGQPFPVVNTVHIAGSALPLQWPLGCWPNSDSTVMIRLYDDGTNGDVTAGDKIFSRNITFPQYTVLRVEYKYSINFGDAANNGGGNDNEAGFAQNHILNMTRFMTGATTVDTFGRMGNSYLTNITGVNDQVVTKPTTYSLSQNYPNPFNPSTTINFALPKESNVTLKVYNMIGQEVMTLINNQRMNSGYHSVKVDGSKLTSGIYIYKLQADDFTATKKMVLMK